MLPLIFAMLSGCGAPAIRASGVFPEQRTGDFTLGLVVFAGAGNQSVEARSARYIIEPGGEFRASFGDGSTGTTYPPITRRLKPAQLDVIWSMLAVLALDGETWQPVPAPEIYHHDLGSTRAFMLEVRVETSFGAWTTPIETRSARELAAHLAELAWVQD